MKRVLIADDHAIVRAGLKQILAERSDLQVSGEAATVDEALDLLKRSRYDLVILDISLGSGSGLDVLRVIQRDHRPTPVLVLSTHAEEFYAVRCLRAGAAGYVSKQSAPDTLIDAIDRVLAGRKYVSPDTAERLAAAPANGSPHELLSNREFEVFRLLVVGKSPTDIARSLFLSVKTISTHRRHILEKMGVSSNADLVRYAIEHHIQ